MTARIICNPPLSHATVIPHDQKSITFTVSLEAYENLRSQEFEIVLWYGRHQNPETWTELPLKEAPVEGSLFFVMQHGSSGIDRRTFTSDLQQPNEEEGPIQFTLKFRTAPEQDWIWANDHFSQSDGELYFQPAVIDSKDFQYYFDGLSADLKITPFASEAPGTILWSLETPVEAAEGGKSGFTDTKLGLPKDYTKWFSLVRIWSPWLAPRHGSGKFLPDKDAILASFLRWDGLHVVLLAVSGVENVLTILKPDGDGNVIISARNDLVRVGSARVIAAVGMTFESANAAVMYHARKIVRGDEGMNGETKAEMKAMIEGDVKPEWLENWYDGLTYCTWNGLGQDLSETKIYNALDALEKNKIIVTNLIIDDNWQSLDNHGESQFKRGWFEFDANKEGFPSGLKHTVSQIRQKHKNIQHIAVWHAILGYWGGIAPDGKIARDYKTIEVRKKDKISSGTMTVVDAEDAPRLYEDFYRFLYDAGIDSVKTDAQFFLDELDDSEDRRRLIQTYQDAWTISSLRWFSIKAISCRLLVRNSDDFFPEIPASHPWHIFCNAHNSLLTQHLNILPDWDMFQTSHPWASFHAAARCVSGGPIYFTDEPYKHDIALINQMTAQTPRGTTVILRPSTIGKSTQVYIGYETERLLKIGTYVGMQRTGTPILGVFNVSQQSLAEVVSLRDFPGAETGEEYVVRAFTTGQVSEVMSKEDNTALVGLDIPFKGWEILAAHPLQSFALKTDDSHEGNTIKIAVLGLLGKMTGAAAIVSSDTYLEGSGRLRIWTSLKALGVLGVYISGLVDRSIEYDFIIIILGKVIPVHAVKKGTAKNILEIDIESAWAEMDLKSGLSNEVAVEIFIK
ncbi:MAG: hypothetical protein M1827_002025 [Pycnora praestabilis]|nr:MAG: hypothetical protein M1827_002025 [Pycnora praestabilis]